MWAICGIVRFLVLDCRSFVVKVDRTYRLFGGPRDFRLTRGQGYGVWAIDRANDIKLTNLTEMNTLVSANYVKKSDRTFIEMLKQVRSPKSNLATYAGVIKLTQYPLEYQKQIRKEWD